MAKTCLDVKAGMPNTEEVEDRGSLGNGMGLVASSWFSTEKKDIVKVGMYERTKQHHQAWQLPCLYNMYLNFIRSEAIVEATVRSQADIERVLGAMFLKFGVRWYWDPTFVDPLAGHNCDLFKTARDQVIRLILTLAFECCEKENDSLGLRALRRVFIPMFRNQSLAATSKYGRYLICDMVHEAAASERSRARMDHLVTTNPSGTRGGGMARFARCFSLILILVHFSQFCRDKFNEVQVKLVKDAISRQHSALRDLQLQTLIRSLSVMTAIHRHNLRSRLYEYQSRYTSSDTVGEEKREVLSNLVERTDPFNLQRCPETDFVHKSSGSPFSGLTVDMMTSFLQAVQSEFRILYPA